MQFAGTTNRVLDLKVIRMASCNQILDPWLYVIFRKNSLLRIIRRLKACISAVQQVPREVSMKAPKMRYIISNKSFTYEASSLGKTNLPGLCCTHAPNMGKHVSQEDCEQARKPECSYVSSDSNAQLMSVCSYCECECKSRRSCNFIADLVPDRSRYTSDVKGVGCDFADNASKCCKCECSDRLGNVEHSHLRNTDRGLSEPFIDASSKPKKLFRSFLTGLDNSISSEANGAYYSLDSTHQPPMVSVNNSKTNQILLSPTTQQLPFIRSPKHTLNPISMCSEAAGAKSMAVLRSPSFLLQPSLTSPHRTAAVRHEEQDNTSTHSSCTGNQSPSPVNIPYLLEHIPEALSVKGNGHATGAKRNHPNGIGERSCCNLQRTPTDTHLYLYTNAKDTPCVYSKDDIHLPPRGADNATRWSTYHNMKTCNLAVTDFPDEDATSMLPVKRASCPHKTKSTFASKLFSFGTTSHNSKSSDKITGSKLCSSNSLLQCVDHSDHIKCFKAKKTTPYLGKNGAAAYLTGLQNQASSCKHSFLDISVGSCPWTSQRRYKKWALVLNVTLLSRTSVVYTFTSVHILSLQGHSYYQSICDYSTLMAA